MTGKGRNRKNSNNNGYSNRRQKNPYELRHKTPPRKKGVKFSVETRKQKEMIKEVKKIAKELGLTVAKEIGTGVDFYLEFKRNGKKIRIPLDFKFAFGAHFGDEHIKARITPKNGGKRRLINNSKWTFSIDANNEIHVFKTKSIDRYVKEFFGRIRKDSQIDKINYVEVPINISDMLYSTQSKSMVVNFNKLGIRHALEIIKELEGGPIPKSPRNKELANETKNGTIIDKRSITRQNKKYIQGR